MENLIEAAKGQNISRRFVLAGKAIFTVHNAKGDYFTYRVKRLDREPIADPMYFVYLKRRPDDDHSWTYLGVLNEDTGAIRLTRASALPFDSKEVRVVQWALRLVWQGKDFPPGYGARHAGRCGRCGTLLTAEPGVNPEGVRFGFGPVCWEKVRKEVF